MKFGQILAYLIKKISNMTLLNGRDWKLVSDTFSDFNEMKI